MDKVKVCDEAGRSEEAAEENVCAEVFGDDEFFSFYEQGCDGDDEGERVAKERFLHGRQVAREAHEKGHEREAHGREYDAYDSFCLVVIFHRMFTKMTLHPRPPVSKRRTSTTVPNLVPKYITNA